MTIKAVLQLEKTWQCCLFKISVPVGRS